ncbi:MAG: Wzz/FepE/Etk N-terminal domain-containing protein [Promethearchaeota archaeon]
MTEKNKQSEINLLDILKIIWKERKIISIITGCFVLMAIIYAFLATPWYEAKIKILPSENNENILLKQYSSIAAFAGINIPFSGVGYHYFYPEILKSDFILNRVLEKHFWIESRHDSLTLFEFWGVEIDSTKKDWKIELYEKAKNKLRKEYIHVEIDELTEIITLSVTVPEDRGLASELANYLIDLLDIYNKTNRKTNATEQRKFIEKAIKYNKKKLLKAEENLMIFENQNKDIASPEQRIMYERLKTDVEIYRNIVLELRKQLELIKIEEVKQTPTLNIIEKAEKPYFKKKPKLIIIFLVFIILGIISSLIYILIINYNKTLFFSFKKIFND